MPPADTTGKTAIRVGFVWMVESTSAKCPRSSTYSNFSARTVAIGMYR